VKTLEEMIRELPPELRQEVKDFIRSLLRRRREPAPTLRQDWGGALKDYRDRFTALDLEQKALGWRGD
jgi:hypothetical protein